MSGSAQCLHGFAYLTCLADKRSAFTNDKTKGIPTEMRSISTTSFTKSGGVNVLAPSPFGGMIHKKATVAFLCACRA